MLQPNTKTSSLSNVISRVVLPLQPCHEDTLCGALEVFLMLIEFM